MAQKGFFAMGSHQSRLSGKRGSELEGTIANAYHRKPKREELKTPGTETFAFPIGSSLQGRVDLLADGKFSDLALANTLVSLQRQQGNAWVQRIVKRLQASTESQAEEESLEKTVQDLQQQKGSGHPIEGETRRQMEESLGYDLGQVRLHTDGTAHRAAEALGAKAFTMGTDIFFNERHGGALSSSEGKGLLAHELTHVVQQSQGNLSLPGDKVKMGQPGDIYEREADRVAESVLQGAPLQRQLEEEEELQMKANDLQLQRQGGDKSTEERPMEFLGILIPHEKGEKPVVLDDEWLKLLTQVKGWLRDVADDHYAHAKVGGKRGFDDIFGPIEDEIEFEGAALDWGLGAIGFIPHVGSLLAWALGTTFKTLLAREKKTIKLIKDQFYKGFENELLIKFHSPRAPEYLRFENNSLKLIKEEYVKEVMAGKLAESAPAAVRLQEWVRKQFAPQGDEATKIENHVVAQYKSKVLGMIAESKRRREQREWERYRLAHPYGPFMGF